MMTRLLCLTALGLMGLAGSVDAATRHVRPGGIGSGADWTTACGSVSCAARGDLVYLAGGNWGAMRFSTPASGSTVITIKKATVTDHGSDVGWSPLYAEQAVFDGGLSVSSPYWLIDGVTGGGPGAWTTGFGFKAKTTSDTVISVSASNVTLRHLEGQGNGGDGDGSGPAQDIFGIYDAGVSNVTLSYAYLYDSGRCIYFLRGSNLVFEYNYTGRHESTAAQHSEVASVWSGGAPLKNVTFRYNVFTHSEGTGGLMVEGDGLYVYGNIFVARAGTSLGGGNGLIGTWTASALTNMKVYNNTVVNAGVRFIGLLNSNDTGAEVRNNLIVNSSASNDSLGLLMTAHSHNHYAGISDGPVSETTQSTGAVAFVDAANLNFTPTVNTPAGQALAAPYNVDMNGRQRTTGTRGAIEYAGGAPPPPPPPPPPPGPTSFSLNVERSGQGPGDVNSAPAGIACGADCDETYPAGTLVTLTAVPSAPGSTFTRWSGACTGSSPTCVITMDATKMASADFAQGPVVPPPPPTPPPAGKLIVTTTIADCTHKLVGLPPDSSSGWQARFKIDGVQIGTIDTAPPYERTISSGPTVKPGAHQAVVEWLKAGMLVIAVPVQEAPCP